MSWKSLSLVKLVEFSLNVSKVDAILGSAWDFVLHKDVWFISKLHFCVLSVRINHMWQTPNLPVVQNDVRFPNVAAGDSDGVQTVVVVLAPGEVSVQPHLTDPQVSGQDLVPLILIQGQTHHKYMRMDTNIHVNFIFIHSFRNAFKAPFRRILNINTE